jgi:hypothetical protein
MRHKVNELWMALTAYQPKANAGGHGESWALMCSKRTADAAYAAGDAAKAVYTADASADYAYAAAWNAASTASHVAAATAADAAWAVNVADTAIYYINKAQGKLNER